ncbi:MAG: hypothetical protein K6U74_09875 [Firmicutes bacterium]|nr:hypothetical protein [Bacillota bacterium]
MPIKGWTDGARLPRTGVIALGYIDEGNNAPKAVDYFVVPPEVQEVYGNTPRELDIMVPHEDLEVVMPAYLKRYGDKFGLICRGDGETAHLSVNYGNLAEYGVVWQNGRYVSKDTGEVFTVETIKGRRYVKIPCTYKDCPSYKAKKCREVAILSVLLYKVPGGIGVYSIDTGSFNSYQNIKNALEMLRAMFGRISLIPLKLKVTMQEKNPSIEKDGKTIQIKRSVPVMYIDLGQYTLEDVLRMAREQKLLAIAHMPAALPMSIEPPDEDVKPALLYTTPDSDMEEGVEASGETNGGASGEASGDPVPNKPKPAATASTNEGESVSYRGMVAIISPPSDKGKKIGAVGKDDRGEVILICNPDSDVKEAFLNLKPEDVADITGQMKENGRRYILVESIEVIPF